MAEEEGSEAEAEGVLIVGDRALPSRGGLAVATSRIARQAASRGERAHLLCFSKEVAPGARGRREEGGLIVHPLGRDPDPERALRALTEHAVELMREHRLDLAHGLYATTAGYAATLAAAMAGGASVVSLRGNDLDRGLYLPRDLPFLRFAVERATRVTAVSAAGARQAEAIFGRPVRHITNSVDAARFGPETRDNSLVAALGLGGAAVLGFVGELREKKGMRFLLLAFARLLERRLAAGAEARLLLIGGLRAEAEEGLARFLELAPEAAPRIQVVPYDRHPRRLRQLLALCDLLVFPSLMEGTPNAALEAMACGRPVLATAVGGHLELIEHGVSGALLPLDAFDRLPEAMEEMLAMPEAEREALGAAARARVLAHHRPEQESEAYAALYAEARGRRILRSA